jgi:hypothetical protein
MDIKRKNMWYSNLKKKTFISRYVLHQHRYICPIALPVRRNPQPRSVFDCCLDHFRIWSGNICEIRLFLRKFLEPVVNRFTRQTIPNLNRKRLFMNMLYIEPFFPQKPTTERCSSTVRSSRTVAILTTETSIWTWRMRFCYLDCFEAGLCCYLLLHIENLLYPLQQFYFRLWPTYCLSFVWKVKVKLSLCLTMKTFGGVVLVRKRTMPTEPLVGEVSANFCG